MRTRTRAPLARLSALLWRSWLLLLVHLPCPKPARGAKVSLRQLILRAYSSGEKAVKARPKRPAVCGPSHVVHRTRPTARCLTDLQDQSSHALLYLINT